jgi:hypothetical protein
VRVRRAALTRWLSGGLCAALAFAAPFARQGPARADDVVDEIHYSYGETADSVVVSWRGAETLIEYGLGVEYGAQATATTSAITPVDTTGPFQEARLTGLAPDTTYHYRIGATGEDRTLRTAPTGGFRWVDVGDTASTLCKPWVADVHRLIAEQDPHVVTHGGDISEANVCGAAAVHAYYLDQQVWSTRAAFQPAWGNHEYGEPNHAPPGTPPDQLANYKGRSAITNGQTLAIDTAARTTAPGCPAPVGGTGNGCRGEDWGWFRAGGVLFISYPEPWKNALTDWASTARTLMTQAQADPTVDFIVTYGHRPAYSSLPTNGAAPMVTAAIEGLATTFSPRPDNPHGKYVLNVGHHAHALEVFRPINGLRHITNGTGGQGQISPSNRHLDSMLFVRHPGILSTDYDPVARTLAVRWLCGPAYTPNPKDPCVYGEPGYTTIIGAAPPLPREWVTNPSVETDLTGWTGRYGPSANVTVTRSTADGAHSGTAAIKVAGEPGANNLNSGFNDNPRLIAGTSGGTPYTASVWVYPMHANQVIELRLREWSTSGALVSERSATITGPGQWQQLTATLTPAQSGTRLAFAVFARDLDAGEAFLADDLSLTTPG